MKKIPTLTHQKEIELLKQAKKGRTEYDVLDIYHDASEEEIKKAFGNKIKSILDKYLSKDKIKEIKKISKEKKQDYIVLLNTLTNVLANNLNQDKSLEGQKNQAEFEEIKKAYEILSDKQKKAIYDKKNKEFFATRNRAVRLLICYNQPFVKYWVSRSYYSQSVDSEDLANVGTIALLEAIKKFDLTRAKEYRLATYAGNFVRQQTGEFVKKSQLIPEAAVEKKTCDFCKKEFKILELKKAINEQKYICNHCLTTNITLETVPVRPILRSTIYYDKNYSESGKDESSSLLADTLEDEDNEEKVKQQKRESRIEIDNLLSKLDYWEELIIRLYHGLTPTDLTPVFRLVPEQKEKKLKKIKEDFFLLEEKTEPLVKKYWNFLSKPRKKEAVFQEITQPEFWKYFREFPELTTKVKNPRKRKPKKTSEQSTQKKEENDLLRAWLDHQYTKNFSKEEIRRWINLGYQPEDTHDSQNFILQKLGINKKKRQEWETKASKPEEKKWFEFNLTKKIEKLKKDSEKKLKTGKEK